MLVLMLLHSLILNALFVYYPQWEFSSFFPFVEIEYHSTQQTGETPKELAFKFLLALLNGDI